MCVCVCIAHNIYAKKTYTFDTFHLFTPFAIMSAFMCTYSSEVTKWLALGILLDDAINDKTHRMYVCACKSLHGYRFIEMKRFSSVPLVQLWRHMKHSLHFIAIQIQHQKQQQKQQ